VQVLNGPGAAGVNRVAWAFAGKPAARAPLGAVQKRDSALQMNRIVFVLDSLDKAGASPMMTGMLRQLVRTGDLTPLVAMFQGRGGGGGGFGPPAPWNPRPGEQATAGGGRGGGGGGAPAVGAPSAAGLPAGAAPSGAPPALDQSAFQTVMPLFTIPGRAAGGGFGLEFLQTLGFGNAGFAAFAGGGGAGVTTGDYLAVMTVGGKTLRQRIRVERGTP
jgi:hypothetical protein